MGTRLGVVWLNSRFGIGACKGNGLDQSVGFSESDVSFGNDRLPAHPQLESRTDTRCILPPVPPSPGTRGAKAIPAWKLGKQVALDASLRGDGVRINLENNYRAKVITAS